MSDLQEYKAWWRASQIIPLPSASEKCQCGHRLQRRVLSTIICAECRHEVKSYSRCEPKRGESPGKGEGNEVS